MFDMMHSYRKDDTIDRFYATGKENIDDAGLLEASGFSSSPSQWNFFELPQDGKWTYLMVTPSYQSSTFTDDSSPFARPRDASKAKPYLGHVTNGTSRSRAVTIANSNLRKQPAVQLASTRGHAMRAAAMRVAPTPMAGLTKKPQQIKPLTRPATVTGRIASTSRIGPVSTSRVHARPATSVSLRPPTAVTRTVRLPSKSQTGITPLVVNPEIVLEFESVDSEIGRDDFMFDV